MFEGVPDVAWIDGLQVGTFMLREFVARDDDVRSAPLSCHYLRPDNAIKDREFWTFYGEDGSIVAKQPRRAGQGEQCAVTHFSSHSPANILWGRPVQSRFGVCGGRASVYTLRNPFHYVHTGALDSPVESPLASVQRHCFNSPHRLTFHRRGLRLRIWPPSKPSWPHVRLTKVVQRCRFPTGSYC